MDDLWYIIYIAYQFSDSQYRMDLESFAQIILIIEYVVILTAGLCIAFKKYMIGKVIRGISVIPIGACFLYLLYCYIDTYADDSGMAYYIAWIMLMFVTVTVIIFTVNLVFLYINRENAFYEDTNNILAIVAMGLSVFCTLIMTIFKYFFKLEIHDGGTESSGRTRKHKEKKRKTRGIERFGGSSKRKHSPEETQKRSHETEEHEEDPHKRHGARSRTREHSSRRRHRSMYQSPISEMTMESQESYQTSPEHVTISVRLVDDYLIDDSDFPRPGSVTISPNALIEKLIKKIKLSYEEQLTDDQMDIYKGDNMKIRLKQADPWEKRTESLESMPNKPVSTLIYKDMDTDKMMYPTIWIDRQQA